MTVRSFFSFLFIFCTVVFFSAEKTEGQEFLKEFLARSPGPLTQPHADYDHIQNCVDCHSGRLGGAISGDKCMSCHTEIHSRVSKKLGYHAEKTVCQECHTDHKGKNYSIFAPENWLKAFDHDETGYELVGKHARIDCTDCHDAFRKNVKTKVATANRTYLDASTRCYDCHKKDYEHNFAKKELLVCTQCHAATVEKWKTLSKAMSFDHDKTDYPLEGFHKPVACNECHEPDAKLKRVTTFAPLSFAQCTDCHADPHKGKFGADCTTCHSVYRKWPNVFQGGLKTKASETKFDHAKTKFPLKGYHQAVSCESCHYDPKANFKVKAENFDECSDCHGFPHNLQFQNQKCESCHAVEKKFMESTFSKERHNTSKFPLTGKHQVIDCNKCHFSGQYEEVKFAECSDCHRNPHSERQIDKTCSFCHVTTSFSWIQFDHNKNTDFRLTGKHRDVACLSCHVDQVFKDMPASNEKPNCQACHADPHGPGMPDDCENCHRTESFKWVKNFDHSKTGNWTLEGKHAELSCQKCHADHLLGSYKVVPASPALKPTDCATCHLDVHNGSYGKNCQSCHNMNSFSVHFGEMVHDLGYFKLEGQHNQLPCTDCHRPDTNLQGMGIVCDSCHEKNDIHLGKFGDQCGDCHRQTAWLPSKFKHNQTAFRLTGAHRYVECSSCHVNQIYQGLPNDCYFCHSDSQLVRVPQHNSGSAQECSDCHSTISWTIRRGGGIR